VLAALEVAVLPVEHVEHLAYRWADVAIQAVELAL
jgi:hypothetical protein